MGYAYQAIEAKTIAAFSNSYTDFKHRLENSCAKDQELIERINDDTERMSVPLTAEDLEIETQKGGKRLRSVVSLGKCITLFTGLIQAEEVRLRDMWEQWVAVDAEYALLAEDFVVVDDGALRRDGRLGKHFDLSNDKVVTEMTAEVNNIREQSIKKMKGSERVRISVEYGYRANSDAGA